MPDIRFLQQADARFYSIELDLYRGASGLLSEDDGLVSAIILALGTDATAKPSDELPTFDDDDRRGWWGDLDGEEIWGAWPSGSRLWLLERARILEAAGDRESTITLVETYVRECMRPFIERRFCSRVDVSVTRPALDRIEAMLTIYRGPLPAIELRYAELWEELMQPNVIDFSSNVTQGMGGNMDFSISDNSGLLAIIEDI